MKDKVDKVLDINIIEEMKKSYIDYSMSVIVSRALPDVRDGLKPVHRRIMYSMNELRLYSDRAHRKSAKIVGEVLGNYHPHGDASIYNSMVRLAQDFSTRYPLVDGQGNFGSIDGDSAAAMRYTEAKMKPIAMELLKDIDKDTVDFYPNFDESTEQPDVMPSRFPNLLVNGSTGIAVGMTTSIPPHNLKEVIDAINTVIDDKDVDISELLQIVKGPDFPTGAIALANDSMYEAYRNGQGKVVIRSRANIEERSNGRYRIVITEIPYMLNKTKMLEDIANLVKNKRIDGITELRDESNRHGIRVVLEIRRDANANVILNQLYKNSSLQTTFSMIFIALDKKTPKTFNLKEMIEKYIEHQKEVETRRLKFDLDKALKRSHILEGLLKALDHIDEIIKIIRASYDDAKEKLIEAFDFSDIQAQSILDMRLRRLQGLEYEKLDEELKELKALIEYINDILSNEYKLMELIKEDLTRIRDKYGDDRRTSIEIDYEEIDALDLIEEKEMVITLTKQGYIKRISQDIYQSQNRGGRGITALSTKDEDYIHEIFTASTHHNLLFFTDKGRLFDLKTYKIPESSRQSRGTPIINLLQIENDEKISQIIPVKNYDEGYVMLMTKKGYINKFKLSVLKTNRVGGINVFRLEEGDKLVDLKYFTEGDAFVSTKKGKSIRFNHKAVRATGRGTRGVIAIRLDKDDSVVSMNILQKSGYILTISENGFGKRTNIDEYRSQRRGGKGLINYRVNEKTGDVITVLFVEDSDEIMLINSKDIIIRIRVNDINVIGRSTSGVGIMRLQDDAKVVSCSKVFLLEEGSEDGA